MTTLDDLCHVGMNRARMIGLLDAALRASDVVASLRSSARRFARQGRDEDSILAGDMAFAAELGGAPALIEWRRALETLA